MKYAVLTLFATSILLDVSVGMAADPRYPEVTTNQIDMVRRAMASFKTDQRGPYSRLRWFCADGTNHPPAGTPCRERGGGVQHAELKDEARELETIGFHFGTILQALDYGDFFDEAHDFYRLRELVVERHLIEIDDGWVLRRARFYRGARQIEDEEKVGRQYLERLLSRPQWTSRHFLLASELVATVPHGAGVEERTDRIRNLAGEVADLDPTFQDLRVKIHSFPSRGDLSSVESFRKSKSHPETVRQKLLDLEGALHRMYEPARWSQELAPYAGKVGEEISGRLKKLEDVASSESPRATLSAVADLALEIRSRVGFETDGRRNLALMDLLRLLLQRAYALSSGMGEGEPAVLSRRERLEFLMDHIDLATAAGLLSFRERGAFDEELTSLLQDSALTASRYGASLRYLARSLDWGVGTVRSSFSSVVDRYQLIETKASGFTDDTVRGSPLLFLASEIERLTRDLDRIVGQAHEIFGTRVGQGVRGLNPGVSARPLEVIEPGAREARLESTRIYVIPETIAELTPPAGVLTLDAGNPLSHVQLLARNAGIPNATISSAFLPTLRKYHGQEVFYAVSPMGTVVLKPASKMTERERALLAESRQTKSERIRLDTSRLRLDRNRPTDIADLSSSDIGAIVGPKAGKVAELARQFPGKVSSGLALPFGMFASHVKRSFRGEAETAHERLVHAYGRLEQMRLRGVSEDEIDAMMFSELAHFREAVIELEWIPEMRAQIVGAMKDVFGDDLSKGVFVRSDTNVEDLPQFSGAGLNLTVPHQRSVEAVLTAVKRVWTSPFTERAYLWRKQILLHQGEVYPSVLLLESVPSEKSGVLITSGLQYGVPADLTVAVAEGVGGAVDGEEAETLLIRADGSSKLLSQAKAVLQKKLVVEGDEGGIRIVPTEKPDRLLTENDIRQLLELVHQWKIQAGADSRIWDFEFGFVRGKLWLFQVRPFVRFRNTELLDRLRILDENLLRNGQRPVSLEEKL